MHTNIVRTTNKIQAYMLKKASAMRLAAIFIVTVAIYSLILKALSALVVVRYVLFLQMKTHYVD